jgi:transcriptional regulator of met regulon
LKLGKLYELIIQAGIDADPRGKEPVERELKELNIWYRKLPEKQKREFDHEKLKNPYSDTRILHGNKNKEVRRILVGIDIGVGEILLAERLKRGNQKIDLIMSHHPQGHALAAFFEVMPMQVDILSAAGLPVNIAEDFLSARIKEVERRILSANHFRVVDAARLLDTAFICAHTPSDNFAVRFLNKIIHQAKPKTVDDILERLRQIPEYNRSYLQNAGPKVIIGQGNRRAGKVFVDMTGGTEGSKEIFDHLAQAGVGTILCMHLSEEHFKKAKAAHINVVVCGHVASDTLGLNLLLDEIQKKERLDIVSCSGFQRVQRKARD